MSPLAPPAQVQISDGKGGWIRLKLGRDEKGKLLFTNRTLDPVAPSVTQGEATYAAFLPRVSGVYVQPDLSNGCGKRVQVVNSDTEDAKRYYYTDWLDASVPGQIQKGPLVTSLTAPANSGPLAGGFELGGNFYLLLGRLVSQYNPTTDALVAAAKDFGAGKPAYSAVKFFQLGAETSDQTSTTTGASETLNAATVRLAQKVTPGTTQFLGRVDVQLTRSGTVNYNMRLTAQADLNGQPSGVALATAEKLASEAPAVAGVVAFRFDDNETFLQVKNEPYWLVLDAIGAAAATTIAWTRGAASSYAGGTGAVSTDSGATWTLNAGSTDFYFTTYSKAITATAFIGAKSTEKFWATADAVTFTQDGTYEGLRLAVYEDMLIRDCRSSSTGAISYSFDGKNWSEPVICGDPTIPVTNILVLPQCILVCTENAIWAVDPPTLDLEVTVDLLYSGGRSTSNGVGACVWLGDAYIPFDGRLVGVSGDFASGFTVHKSIGPEASDEWDNPWGPGRVVAVAPGRYDLYAAMSTTTTYKLFKSRQPMRARWHGAIADLGTASAFTDMVVWDRGGANNPILFASTTSDNIAKIILPRSSNPAGDSAYRYDNTHDGLLVYPVAHGNFQVSSKSWLAEAVTLSKTVAGGKVEIVYDLLEGDGVRYLGGLYGTNVLSFPPGVKSLLLWRELIMTNPATTECPIVVASGLTHALRTDPSMRELRFTVEVDKNLSARQLGDMLGISAIETSEALRRKALTGGTRTVVDYRGEWHTGVLFIRADETLIDFTADGSRTAIELVGVIVR